jgi:GxxExxY protein
VLLHGQITEGILGAAIEVHGTLGPGLLESAYEECLAHEFRLRKLEFQRQVALPLNYKGVLLDCGYRMDFVVEDAVLVELKCVERILPIHEAQLLTYLKLSRKRVGLLLNFNAPVLREGIFRKVL